MAGLLDNGPGGLLGTSWDDPRTTAAFSAARGLLSAPKFAVGLLDAGSDYAGSLADSKRRQQMDALRAMQMQQAQRAMGQQAMQDKFRESIPSPQMANVQSALSGGGGPTQANASGISQADPSAMLMHGALQSGLIDPMQYITSQRKDNTPIKLGAGDALYQPGTFKQLAFNPKEDKLDQLVVMGPDGKPQINQLALQAKQAVAQAGRPQVSVETKFENEYSKDQGKSFSELMSGINKSAFTAPSQIRKLERMTQLLDGVDGGKLAPTGLDIASAMNSFGIKIDPRLGNKEAAEAVARELAGGLRQPGTGPMTDKDFDNFLTQVPSLSKSAAGRKQIMTTMTGALNRDMGVAKIAREYSKRNGRIDNNFLDELSSYIAENPVVSAPANWKVQR